MIDLVVNLPNLNSNDLNIPSFFEKLKNLVKNMHQRIEKRKANINTKYISVFTSLIPESVVVLPKINNIKVIIKFFSFKTFVFKIYSFITNY